MKKGNKVFTDAERAVLKKARTILARVEKKYNRWYERNEMLPAQLYRTEDKALQDWADKVFDEGHIDFSTDGSAFIKL